MMADIVKLPTAATSYYTVQKWGAEWAVVLVTPAESKKLRTTVCRTADRELATSLGKAAAHRALRPFKDRGAGQ